jgi:hypothetical protein
MKRMMVGGLLLGLVLAGCDGKGKAPLSTMVICRAVVQDSSGAVVKEVTESGRMSLDSVGGDPTPCVTYVYGDGSVKIQAGDSVGTDPR